MRTAVHRTSDRRVPAAALWIVGQNIAGLLQPCVSASSHRTSCGQFRSPTRGLALSVTWRSRPEFQANPQYPAPGCGEPRDDPQGYPPQLWITSHAYRWQLCIAAKRRWAVMGDALQTPIINEPCWIGSAEKALPVDHSATRRVQPPGRFHALAQPACRASARQARRLNSARSATRARQSRSRDWGLRACPPPR